MGMWRGRRLVHALSDWWVVPNLGRIYIEEISCKICKQARTHTTTTDCKTAKPESHRESVKVDQQKVKTPTIPLTNTFRRENIEPMKPHLDGAKRNQDNNTTFATKPYAKHRKREKQNTLCNNVTHTKEKRNKNRSPRCPHLSPWAWASVGCDLSLGDPLPSTLASTMQKAVEHRQDGALDGGQGLRVLERVSWFCLLCNVMFFNFWPFLLGSFGDFFFF